MRTSPLIAAVFVASCAYHVSIVNESLELLSSPAGAHIAHVAVLDTAARLEQRLARLSEVRHPWLCELDVLGLDVSRPIDRAIVTRLIDATPNLRSLQISGHRLLDEFPHPSLVRLTVDGFAAIGSLSRADGAPFANVVELDFAIQGGTSTEASEADLRGLFPPSMLPALRRLRLSRNEPGFGGGLRNQGGNVPFFAFFRSLEITRQLTHVQLPAVRTAKHASELQAALANMPALEHLSIARNYVAALRLHHPTAVLEVPAPWSWPPRDEVADNLAAQLALEPAIAVNLIDGIAVLERIHDQLSDIARAAWQRSWAAIRQAMQHDTTTTLPIGVLFTAMRECGDRFEDDSWRALARRVAEQQSNPDRLVQIRVAEVGKR